MNRDDRSSSQDPTAEPVADQSTQTASGLSSGRGAPEEGESPRDEEIINRREPNPTPRRYEIPVEEEDPVMPADDSTLNTKI